MENQVVKAEATTAPGEQEELDRGPIRRIRWFTLLAFAAFAVYYLIRRDWNALAGLTCSTAVVMINFLWLEELAVNVLGPTPQNKPWRMGFRALARYALFGVAAAVFVVRFNVLSVLLGISTLVIGVVAEVVYMAATHRDPVE